MKNLIKIIMFNELMIFISFIIGSEIAGEYPWFIYMCLAGGTLALTLGTVILFLILNKDKKLW